MNIAKTIDHTLLKPEATAADIQALCREAKQYGFASVCVNTCYVRLASELLRGSGVKVCCTVGFPLGAMAPKAKAFEAAQAVADGARGSGYGAVDRCAAPGEHCRRARRISRAW